VDNTVLMILILLILMASSVILPAASFVPVDVISKEWDQYQLIPVHCVTVVNIKFSKDQTSVMHALRENGRPFRKVAAVAQNVRKGCILLQMVIVVAVVLLASIKI
tara:strand:+ start:171 stop:488 length:318 start_codon:yes stop_codon:yes gene_type:complete